jgi:integrase
MSVREAMSILQLTDQYRPAWLSEKKEIMIRYRVRDPLSGRWVQRKEKLNHRKNERKADLLAWARKRVGEINQMLSMGWNPLRDGDDRKAGKGLRAACEDFLRSKEREGRRDDTMRSYRSNVNILLRWVEASETPLITCAAFGEAQARAYMNWSYVERELRPKSFNNIHTFYITLWNWFKEQDYVKENVFMAVKKKDQDPEGGTQRPPTHAERALIKEALEEKQPRFFTFCMLCFYCGIRPKETFMLLPKHFDLVNQSILITRDVAKNKRTMGVAIPDVLMPYIRALELDKQRPDHYVFSKGFAPGNVRKDSRYSGKAWDRMRKRTGLSTEVTMYQLKHAGGEQLSRDGISAVDLMNHLRHQDLKETTTYTKRASQGGVRDVVGKASAF